MEEDLRPAESEEVISSITYALSHKGPKACRVKDDRQRWRMAEEIAGHLQLCGYRFFKRPPFGGFGYLYRGPDEGASGTDQASASGSISSGPSLRGEPTDGETG